MREAAVRRLHPSNSKPYKDSTGPNLAARFSNKKIAIADLLKPIAILKKFREVTLRENGLPSPPRFFQKHKTLARVRIVDDNRINIYFFYYLKTHTKRKICQKDKVILMPETRSALSPRLYSINNNGDKNVRTKWEKMKKKQKDKQ